MAKKSKSTDRIVRATVGSTFIARRAGRYAARSAAAIIAAAPTNWFSKTRRQASDQTSGDTPGAEHKGNADSQADADHE